MVWSIGIKERFLAEPVAPSEKRLGALGPDGQREHPGQMFQQVRPVTFVQGKNDFGVGRCLERVVPERVPDLAVSVNLPVERDRNFTVRRKHRRIAGREINDAESPMAYRTVVEKMCGNPVWPAVT